MKLGRRRRLSRRRVREGGGHRARGGRAAGALVRAGRKAPRRRRRSASSSGATSCPATTPGSTVSTRRSGARRTGPRSSSITWRRPRSTRAARPRRRRGKGHDLFLFISPPAAYERQASSTIQEIVEEVERRHGKMIPLAHKSTFNPEDRKVLRVLRLLRSGPGQLPHRPLERGRLSRTGPTPGRTCARAAGRSGRSSATRSASASRRRWTRTWRCAALLWSFGGAEQDEQRPPGAGLEGDGRGAEVRARALQGDRDAGGLHLGPVLEQPHDARRAAPRSSRTRSR